MKTIFTLTFLGLSLLLSSTLTEAASPQPVANATKEKMVLADHDGDGLSDHLQQRLATLPASEPLAVVVTFSAPGNAAAAQRAVGPFKIKREFGIINGFAATMTAGQARALARTPGVFRVEEDFRVTTMLNAANSDFGTAAARSSFGVSGAGVGICIVDTGVDPGHEQLDGGKVADFIDYVNGQATAYDDHGHGTHVAAIAAGDGSGGASAAAFQGVAPGATVYAAKVLDAAGSGSDSDVIAGVQWCVDQGERVQIISMSLGSAGASDGKDALSQAVNSAVSAGKVVVVAAGNSGDGEGTVGSPGAAAGAITVGAAAEWSAAATAANHSNGIYLAPFSSRGPTLDGRQKPDILAPGVSVTSAAANTATGYATWSGTSMATPFVAGTVALVLQNPTTPLTPVDIKSLLTATAQDRGSAGLDNDWGAGLIDGFRLVANAQGNSSVPPTSFPLYQRATSTVPVNGSSVLEFTLSSAQLGVPIAATLTILNGEYVCIYGSPWVCDLLGGWAWTPDIDAELIHPNGTLLAKSECPLRGDCGAVGRQETLTYLPAKTTDVGTYHLRMYQFSDDPGGAMAGEVAIDLSTGPVQTGPPPENNEPVITSSAPSSATEDLPYSYAAEADDPDGPSEIWSVRGDDTCGGMINPSGVYTFTPPGPVPPETCILSIRVCDGGSPDLCDDQVTIIAINAVNDPPIANDDSGAGFSTSTETSFTTGNVLVNDADPEGSSLTIINHATTSAHGGAVSYQDNGTFFYDPPISFSGTDSFTYYANDGTEDSENPATVSLTVTPAAPSLHVSDLDGTASIGKQSWTATVIVTVHDAGHKPASGAVVRGSWSDGKIGSCTTTRKGQCKLTSNKITLGSITFTVDSLNGLPAGTPDQNTDSDNSDGKSITVYKPPN